MLEHWSFAELHQGSDGRGSRVELSHLVLVDNAPVAVIAGIEGSTLELNKWKR